MKRIGNLYHKIYNIDNLRLADKNARKGKLLQKSVINHIKNSESNILELQQMLLTKSFINSKYNTFTIFDKKERIIYVLPYYPDRILHHAILNVTSSIFIKYFIQQTYSCIPKRGIHKCLTDIKTSLLNIEETKYCLK